MIIPNLIQFLLKKYPDLREENIIIIGSYNLYLINEKYNSQLNNKLKFNDIDILIKTEKKKKSIKNFVFNNKTVDLCINYNFEFPVPSEKYLDFIKIGSNTIYFPCVEFFYCFQKFNGLALTPKKENKINFIENNYILDSKLIKEIAFNSNFKNLYNDTKINKFIKTKKYLNRDYLNIFLDLDNNSSNNKDSKIFTKEGEFEFIVNRIFQSTNLDYTEFSKILTKSQNKIIQRKINECMKHQYIVSLVYLIVKYIPERLLRNDRFVNILFNQEHIYGKILDYHNGDYDSESENIHFWESIEDYNSEIISVFAKESQITKDIENIKDKSSKIVADFGCGSGNSFPYLKKFKKIYALDYSKNLLEQANNKIEELSLENIELIEHDTKQDIKLPQKCNLILAISSIFPDNLNEFYQQIQILKDNCKKGGEIYLTFASLESRTFSFILDADNMFKNGENPSTIVNIIKNNELEQGLSSFGYLKTNKGIIQKHWMREELLMRLKEFNFTTINIEKIELDWMTQLKNEKFSKYPNLWLWYVKIKN